MSLGDTRKRRQFVSRVTEKEIIPSSHRLNLAVEEKSEVWVFGDFKSLSRHLDLRIRRPRHMNIIDQAVHLIFERITKICLVLILRFIFQIESVQCNRVVSHRRVFILRRRYCLRCNSLKPSTLCIIFMYPLWLWLWSWWNSLKKFQISTMEVGIVFPLFLLLMENTLIPMMKEEHSGRAVVVPATEFVEAMTIKKKLGECFSLYQQWILDTINDIISWCGRRMVGMRWNRWIAAIDLSKNYWNLIKTMIANHKDHIRSKTTRNKENSRFIILLARKAYLLKKVVLISLIRLYVVCLNLDNVLVVLVSV